MSNHEKIKEPFYPIDITSESKKPGQIAVVHYCDLSRFFDSDVRWNHTCVLILVSQLLGTKNSRTQIF